MRKIKNTLLILTFLMITAGVLNGPQVNVNADTAVIRSQPDNARVQEKEPGLSSFLA